MVYFLDNIINHFFSLEINFYTTTIQNNGVYQILAVFVTVMLQE